MRADWVSHKVRRPRAPAGSQGSRQRKWREGGREGAGQQARLAGRGAGDVAHAETPLASRVNTDDFSVCPYELTLLEETREEGRER